MDVIGDVDHQDGSVVHVPHRRAEAPPDGGEALNVLPMSNWVILNNMDHRIVLQGQHGPERAQPVPPLTVGALHSTLAHLRPADRAVLMRAILAEVRRRGVPYRALNLALLAMRGWISFTATDTEFRIDIRETEGLGPQEPLWLEPAGRRRDNRPFESGV